MEWRRHSNSINDEIVKYIKKSFIYLYLRKRHSIGCTIYYMMPPSYSILSTAQKEWVIIVSRRFCFSLFFFINIYHFHMENEFLYEIVLFHFPNENIKNIRLPSKSGCDNLIYLIEFESGIEIVFRRPLKINSSKSIE
mgnify:CR=1 FL=1